MYYVAAITIAVRARQLGSRRRNEFTAVDHTVIALSISINRHQGSASRRTAFPGGAERSGQNCAERVGPSAQLPVSVVASEVIPNRAGCGQLRGRCFRVALCLAGITRAFEMNRVESVARKGSNLLATCWPIGSN